MGPREVPDTDNKRFPMVQGSGEQGKVGQHGGIGATLGKGKKRPHHDDLTMDESTDSSDCDYPLAKKINSLNLEYPEQQQKQPPVGEGRQYSQEFNQKYPFPQDSSYFSSNRLLNTLYEERVRRNPLLKHEPT